MPAPIDPTTTGRRTALQLLNAVQAELALTQSGSVGATDTETVQLVALMNALGEDLSRLPLWAETREVWTITTTTAEQYALPSDWLVPLNGTSWDRTGRWPLLGPKTPVEWQYLQSGFGVAAPQYRYRFYGGYFNLFPAPVADLTIVHEYLSASWVLGVSGTGLADTGKRRISDDTDYPLLDERMLIEGTKLRFLEEKGLDTNRSQEKFENMLEAAWANSNAAPVLSYAPLPANIFITEWNAPDTGYGT
jgi:hypothetical protein